MACNDCYDRVENRLPVAVISLCMLSFPDLRLEFAKLLPTPPPRWCTNLGQGEKEGEGADYEKRADGGGQVIGSVGRNGAMGGVVSYSNVNAL